MENQSGRKSERKKKKKLILLLILLLFLFTLALVLFIPKVFDGNLGGLFKPSPTAIITQNDNENDNEVEIEIGPPVDETAPTPSPTPKSNNGTEPSEPTDDQGGGGGENNRPTSYPTLRPTNKPITPSNPSPSPTKKPSSGGNGGGSVTTNDNKQRFLIRTDDYEWQEYNELKIFESNVHTLNGKISPGSFGTFAFSLENTNSFGLETTIEFVETNNYNVDMKYRLKCDGVYVAGNASLWLTAAQLSESSALLSNGTKHYELEWKWFEGANDTQIGTISNADYTLKITVLGEQI